MKFTDQSVVVTGGTRGLGRAIALSFLNEGATVHATYRSNQEAADSLKDQAGEHADRLHLHSFDVADYDAVETFWNGLDELAPDGIQVLVNNAGLRRDSILATMSAENWRMVMDTNLGGSFNMSKFAVQNMVRQRYGRILFIARQTHRHISIGGDSDAKPIRFGPYPKLTHRLIHRLQLEEFSFVNIG